jgi:hypothetical protein
MSKDGINIIITFDDKEYAKNEALELQAKFFMTLAQIKGEREDK